MIIFRGAGDRIRGEEQARKVVAAGSPADSGITLAAWPSLYECEFFACPRRGTTCADPKCKIGSACLAMREIGVDGNGGPLRRRERKARCRLLSGAGEVDVGQAHHRTWIDSNGRRHPAVGYISKQMIPQAWYRRGLVRNPGGAILGKRGGGLPGIWIKPPLRPLERPGRHSAAR